MDCFGAAITKKQHFCPKKAKNAILWPKTVPSEKVVENLLSMIRTKVTWAKFIDLCKEKSIGAYRGRLTKLKEELVNNIQRVRLSTRMARPDSWQAVALYLQLANIDRLHRPGDYPRYLGVFIDGAKVDAYELLACVSIRPTLPLLSIVVYCHCLSLCCRPSVEHRHPFSFVCCLLSVVCCLQYVERRPLFVVCCLLPVA